MSSTEEPLSYARSFKLPKKLDIEKALGKFDDHQITSVFTETFCETFDSLPSPKKPSDWLAQYVEKGQTYTEYLQLSRTLHTPLSSHRKTIYLTLFGQIDKSIFDIDSLMEYTQRFFQMPVKLINPFLDVQWNEEKNQWTCTMSLTGGKNRNFNLYTRYNEETKHSQICVTEILNLLKKVVPDDARCLVALTMYDLYGNDTDLFIAGFAMGNCRVGTFSLYRYDPYLTFTESDWFDCRIKTTTTQSEIEIAERQNLLLLRACRLLTHEICHLFGIDHCIYYSCLMNGSGDLEEDFSQPLYECPIDLRKLHTLIKSKMFVGNQTNIESLSVELWREIFDYFDFKNLWLSFRNLNGKIDAIIDQTMIHLDLDKLHNYGYFLKYIVPSMNVTNVRSLKLGDGKETKLFFTMFPLNSLDQLCSLTVMSMYSSNDNSFHFWHQLSSLKYLQILKIRFWDTWFGHNNSIEEKEFIIRSIFNKGFCPLLKVFEVNTCGRQICEPSISSLMTTTKLTNIQYLSIGSLTFNDLIKLLPALQHIKSFRMDYQLVCNNKQQQQMIFTVPLMPQCIQLHLKLSDDITFEHVEYILKQTPNLKDLFLCGWKHLLDAKRWEMLLSIQCSKVSKFELICTGYICDDDFDNATDDFQEERATTPFWIERNVIIIGDVDSGHDYRYDVVVRFNIGKKNNQGDDEKTKQQL